MNPITPREGAAALRQAVTTLSGRMAADIGDLVPSASAERTAALADKLERLDGVTLAGRARADAPAFDEADLATLDSWIRLADGFTLHDDARELAVRAELARRLRVVRELIAPPAAGLTEDPRDS